MTLPYLGELVFWHWWLLGVALLVLEILAPGAFFMWMAMAGGVVGALLFFIPDLDWKVQLFIFGVLSVAAIVGWRFYLKKNPIESDEPLLNQRGEQYVGRTFILDAEMPNGRGKIRVDDSTWRAQCDDGQDLAVGTQVKVIEIDGTTLKIEPA